MSRLVDALAGLPGAALVPVSWVREQLRALPIDPAVDLLCMGRESMSTRNGSGDRMRGVLCTLSLEASCGRPEPICRKSACRRRKNALVRTPFWPIYNG